MKQLFGSLFICIVICSLLIAGNAGVLRSEETAGESGATAPLIRKVVEAYGGKEVIEGIHSLHIKGKTEALMLGDRGTYELYFKRGRKLLVTTKYTRKWERRILNGDKGYRSGDSLPLEEVFGPRYFAMVYQYKHLNVLYDLLQGTYRIQPAGKTSIGGAAVDVFTLTDKEGAVMDVCIDQKTFHIVRVSGYFKEGNKTMDLSSEFSDFREVGGSIFPFRITNFAGGIKIAQTVVDEYSINPDISDSLFEPRTLYSL